MLGVLSRSIAAQTAVTGTAVVAETGSPIAGARVTLLSRRTTSVADRFGQFTVWAETFPDTLVVAFIGRQPDSTALLAPPVEPLRIRLKPAAAVLSDVIVQVPAKSADQSLTAVGQWQLTLGAMRNLPPAVETDIYRALILVPGVSFSSVLSARPVVRGYAADESSFRIDGFEVANPYHLGRIFSAFPAEAADQVSVQTAPQSVATGATLAGVMDVTGRTGPEEGLAGGANLSLASLSAWMAGRGAPRWFAAGRAVHVSAVDAVADKIVPYDFQDLYASGLVMAAGEPRGWLTLFASRDDLFDQDLGSGMEWNNLLAGSRWQLKSGGATSVELSASGTRFEEDVTDLPARHSRIDLHNTFGRVIAGVDLGLRWGSSQLRLGSAAGIRSIQNTVVARSGSDFPETDVELSRLEFSSFGDFTRQLGRTLLELGARVDGAGDVLALQPRIRVVQPVTDAISLGLAVGRTSRLYHIVSDPASEPDFAFYDFWINAGVAGVPVPRVDHAALDVNFLGRKITGRASIFGSRASGLGELRPEIEGQSATRDPFRFGKGWTGGAELQISLMDAEKTRSVSGTYVLSWSRRDWGAGWMPWALERRHQVRLFGQMNLGSRWSLAGAFDLASGIPMTPVSGVAIVGAPDPQTGEVVRDSTGGQPVYIFAEENSGRGGGTARVDVSMSYGFQGPWKSRMWAGLSVLNLGFGAVAPLRPVDPQFLASEPSGMPRGSVAYHRVFDLPAVPTITLRAEF